MNGARQAVLALAAVGFIRTVARASWDYCNKRHAPNLVVLALGTCSGDMIADVLEVR